MDLTEHSCKRCGGSLVSIGENRWKCQYCGRIYDEEAAVKNTKTMRELFDQKEQEAINNLRRNLYDAVNAEFISNTDVKNACVELKKHLPNDFAANFYEVACGDNLRAITQHIRKINVEKNMDEIESVINFLIKSLQVDFLLELNNLVERAYKNTDLQLFEKYATLISVEAEKVQNGIYETKLPREVFIAYSSKDMDKVSELCEVLEDQGLQCFVAARNLRHGKGSVENYDKALKEAMDHCKSFVFVSSLNSRQFSCDALGIEIPYIESRDRDNAPSEYRNNYISIPHKFKKPRVEYRIEESRGFNAADGITNEFFDGYERVYSPEEVAQRILKQLVEVPATEAPAPEKKPEPKPEPKKICIGCGTENASGATVCTKCYGRQFVSSVSEYVKIKNQQELEESRRREEARRAAAASAYSAPKQPSQPPKKKKSKGGLIAFIIIAAVVIIIIAAASGAGSGRTEDPSEPNYNEQIHETLEMGVDPDKNQESVDPGSDERGDYTDTYENITFTVSSDFVMTISGSGDIPDFGDVYYTPWYDFELNNDGFLASDFIKEIVISEGITAIGSNAFANFYQLESVTLPSTVKKIGNYAFGNCSDLKSIDLSSVTDIGSNAFSWCSSLSSVDLSDDIMHVGEGAFSETAVYNSSWNNGVIIIDNCVVKVDQNVSTATIPEGIVCIADYACDSMYDLTSIEIPEGIKYIGNYAFNDCDSLISFSIPSSVVSIGEGAFKTCGALQTVTLAEGSQLSTTGSAVFSGCYMLNSINLPTATLLTEIGEEMFYDCEAIGEVSIPDTITRIGAKAFSSCDNLTTITIPTSVTSIGEYAFDGCYDLEVFVYLGSEEQWGQILNGSYWNQNSGSSVPNGVTTLLCMNGAYDPGMQESYTPGLVFSMSSDGSGYSVKSYSGSSAAVVIPSTYCGVPVTEIGSSAFQNNDVVKSIQIPASVVKISASAFYNMSNLQTVTIADESALVEIASAAFYSCESLASFKIPSGVVTLGNQIFQECSSLATVEFEEGCAPESIANSMFRECTLLRSISIPDSVITVGEYAFYGSGIETLYFGENSKLTTIEGSAFNSCMGLKSITLPVSLETVRSSAFNYSENIEYASVPADLFGSFSKTNIKTVVISAGETVPDYFLNNSKSLESITFADSITSIGYRSFYNCSSLKSVTFGEGITSIGEEAFNHCESLEEILLPSALTSIGTYAFSNCTALRTVSLPASLTVMGTGAFYACAALSDVTIGEGITSISDSVFYECSSLKSVTIPETVVSIGRYAFYRSGLESIIIPESVTSLDYYSFADCGSLESVVIAHELESFDQSAFNLSSNIKYATLHASSIAYVSKSCLRSVVITDGDIPVGAFKQCNSLMNVTLPDTPNLIIGPSAFYGCVSLMSITIPENISGIGDSSFAECPNLVEVINHSSKNIVAGDTSSNSQLGANALVVHSGESMIDVVDDYAFITVDGVHYLVGYVGDDTELIFPDNYIGETYKTRANSFASNPSITSVTINGTERIEKALFSGCESLKTVIIGDSVKSIGSSAFYNCNLLESVTIGNGVSVIGSYAFSNCGSLKTISFGSSVEHIADHAFAYCYGLTKISLPASVARMDMNVFDSCTNLLGISFADSSYTWNLYSMLPSDEAAYSGISVEDASTNVSNLESNYNYSGYYWLRNDRDPSVEEVFAD